MWHTRDELIFTNHRILFFKLRLIDSITHYYSFLKSTPTLIEAFTIAFKPEMTQDGPETVQLTPQRAEEGLSHIMGSKTLAKWFLKLNKLDKEAPITLKEIIEHYIDLYLGQIDYKLVESFNQIFEIEKDKKAKTSIIRKCI